MSIRAQYKLAYRFTRDYPYGMQWGNYDQLCNDHMINVHVEYAARRSRIAWDNHLDTLGNEYRWRVAQLRYRSQS
jgi:L-arabinose isomerase